MSTLSLDRARPEADPSMSMGRAIVAAHLIQPLMALPLLLPFWGIWGLRTLKTDFLDALSVWEFVGTFLLLAVLHELLHGLGFWWMGRAPFGELRFGIHLPSLSPYATCRAPVRAASYRWAVALPGLVLGLVPVLVATALGSGLLMGWGLLMTLGASADLLTLWLTRGVPADVAVVDRSDGIGCRIVARAGSPS